MDAFIRWRATFSELPIEGETFWVRPRIDENDLGDDRPKDHDQLIVEWINRFHPDLQEESDLPEKGGLIVTSAQTPANKTLFFETELSDNGVPLHKNPVTTGAAASATPTPAWLGGGVSAGYKQQAAPGIAGQLDESGHRIFLIEGELFTVVEGDLCLDEDELQLWQEAQQAQQALHEATQLAESAGFGEAPVLPITAEQSQLVGMVQDGKYVRWAPGTVLTYCVLKETFPRLEWYEEVVENMRLATEAWEMTCGVEFAYVPTLDNSGSTRPSGALFLCGTSMLTELSSRRRFSRPTQRPGDGY